MVSLASLISLSVTEQCGVELGYAVILALTTMWNFHREVQFNEKWIYLPLSCNMICLTQYIAYFDKSHFIISEGSAGESFHKVG